MGNKLGFWVIWGLFIVYAFGFAPVDRPENMELIRQLVTGDVAQINPAIVALFNIMGVWPLAYACILATDGRGQKVPAWIFAVGSFFLGAFALLPYFALRSDNPQFEGKKTWVIKILDSRITGLLIATAGVGLLLYGLKYGDWADFAYQWQTNRFIHVMSLDFCLLCALFPWLVKDDLQRRGIDNASVFMAIASFPLVAPLVYLSLRPNVSESTDSQST